MASDELSPREIEVIELVLEGYTNKQIAQRLGVGFETVKTHISHICSKLGARNRAHAASLYRQELQGSDEFLKTWIEHIMKPLDDVPLICPLTVETDWGQGYRSKIVFNICTCPDGKHAKNS